MKKSKTNAELVNLILEDKKDKKIQEEELLHLLLERKLSKNTDSIMNESKTFGARMADNIAQFVGSWKFIILFIVFLMLWMTLNIILVAKAFDAYPFILLNLMLSCVAAIQAPVIMMSQNRQEEKDRLTSLNAYKTNLKTEIIIEDLHYKLDQLLENQEKVFQRLDKLEQKK